nr:protein STICHEL-like 3 [Tanacetum cinerariifolium]
MSQRVKGTAIGIDLGTTYSCAAIWFCGKKRVEIIPNEQGNRITPSCVAFNDSELLVGESAKNQIARNPTNTVFGDPKNGCGIPFNWSRIHDLGKSFLDIGRSLSSGLSDSRSKSGSQRDSSPMPVMSDHSTSSPHDESLPLLWTDSDLVSKARFHSQRHKSRHQNLTQKYMPRTFRDLVGQNLAVQALSNAIAKKKVGLLYVFYGPHVPGKTSCP